MLSNLIVGIVAATALTILFSKKLQSSSDWQATITPLASIIGSGFLVSVPLLAGEVGNWAIFAMAALVGAAYLVGGVIRFNIRHAEPLLARPAENRGERITISIEKFSHLVLAFAYFISVAYYLVLLGNFLLKGFGASNPDWAKMISTAILVALGSLGFLRGLGMVERVEKYAVGLNLSVIAALIAGLLWYNASALLGGSWQLRSSGTDFNIHTVQVLLGLLIVVQGFETSRFMGNEFD